jgi:hypothetical protein
MLNHVVLWAYSSIWRAPVTGLRLEIDSLDVLEFAPESVIVERDAFDKVMEKARQGVSPAAWRHAHAAGWC